MNALLPSKLARLVSHLAQADVGALMGVLRLFFGHQIAQDVNAMARGFPAFAAHQGGTSALGQAEVSRPVVVQSRDGIPLLALGLFDGAGKITP